MTYYDKIKMRQGKNIPTQRWMENKLFKQNPKNICECTDDVTSVYQQQRQGIGISIYLENKRRQFWFC